MKKRTIIIIGSVILFIIIAITSIILITKDNKKEVETFLEKRGNVIYDKNGNIVYDPEGQNKITNIEKEIRVQGLVESNNDNYIYIFGGQHFGEFGYEMKTYTTAFIESKNQKCRDYFTSEEYSVNDIEIGDLLITSGDLIKYADYKNYIDTKGNTIVVLKKKDYSKMQEEVLNSENPIITLGEVFSDHLYIEYDIEDNTNSDIVYKFPFAREVYITDKTEIIGYLEEGKKIKIEYDNSDEQYNNSKYADERIKLKSIKVE